MLSFFSRKQPEPTSPRSVVGRCAAAVAPDTPCVLVVRGIYARGVIPRKNELKNPDEPAIGDLARDQTMVRRRIDTSSEKAMFVPTIGLVGSKFTHLDKKEHPNRPVEEERAILFQALENYEEIASSKEFGSYLTKSTTSSNATSANSAPLSIDDILHDPTFGEQVIVQGVDPSQISVGDIFEVENGLSTLKVEISSPRHTCCTVDHKHGTAYGMAGLRRYALTHALGGWFARVLIKGELRDDMRLVRTVHPYPKWTLSYLCTALYGEGDRWDMARCAPSWHRSLEELKELSSIKQLGYDEWGEEVEWLLQKIEEGESSSDSSSSSSDSSSDSSEDDSDEEEGEYRRNDDLGQKVEANNGSGDVQVAEGDQNAIVASKVGDCGGCGECGDCLKGAMGAL